MPSPGEDIQSWSTVAANNGTADPAINWAEGQTRASVNNSARSQMAAHAKNRNLNNGSILTTGTINAQAFLSGVSYTSMPPAGFTVRLKAGLTNTGPMTLSMDGLAAASVRTSNGQEMLGGEFVAGSYVDLLYDGSFWIFLYGREFLFDRMTSGGGIIISHTIYDVPNMVTWIPAAQTECIMVECIGGGGGGGGAYGNTSQMYMGGGGGAGGYSRKILTAAEFGGSQVVTIGGGGTGGASFAAGNAGTQSSFGSLCVANGGAGGAAGTYVPGIAYGGAGANVGTGDIAGGGGAGEFGIFDQTSDTHFNSSGMGASGPFGGAGGSTPYAGGGAQNGGNGTGYGSGGGGASANGNAQGTGGNGANGVVIITEFGGRGAPGRDGNTGAIGPPGPSGPGSGDVLRLGTPTTGQIAQWTDASHIQGVSNLLPVPVNLRTFTVNGTYPTVSNGTVKVLIYCKGGGGGGGGSSVGGMGGGGGEGEEAWKLVSASALSGQAIAIGAGGAGLAANTNSTGNAGGNTSVFGNLQCNGGSGGSSGNSGGAGGAGGTGGVSSTIAWEMPGARGQTGTDVSTTTAILAGGGGKGGGAPAAAGRANSGGGGGGGNNSNPSGAGGSGFVAFLEFGAI